MERGICIEKYDESVMDFVLLCEALDAKLDVLAGGAENRRAYVPHNALDAIKDVFVAYDGGAAVGCASYRRLADGTAEVKRVYVDPARRQKGVARQLMAALERDARQKGLQRLVLETGKAMTRAVGLYQSLGYRTIENYGPYVGMDASVCMEKELQGVARKGEWAHRGMKKQR